MGDTDRVQSLLKQEGAAAASKPNSSLTVAVDDVEYTYQGTTRNGADMLVTLLVKSVQGENAGPVGQMFLFDDEGNKYSGMPS